MLVHVFLCSLRVVVSMRQRCLRCWHVLFLPLFLIHIVFHTSSLGCNALCMVICFLVLWSICFWKGPEYLTRGTTQVFIPLIRFVLHSFVSSSFLVLLRYSFWILSFISICLVVSASKMPKCFLVSFSPRVLVLSWFDSYIPSFICRLPLFLTSKAHFSMPNSIPMSPLYILTACIRVSSMFSFFTNSLMSFMYIDRMIFSCDLLSLYPAVHFLSMRLNGIVPIMNS